MAAEEKNKKPGSRISGKERLRYIGFEVFPGQPKELFKSDAEKAKFEENLKAKREKGQNIREQCTLMEARVSMGDRVVMLLASLAIIGALFVPWYAAYNEIEEETVVSEPVAALVDSMTLASDSLLSDSLELTASDSMIGTEDDTTLTTATAAVETPAEPKQEGQGTMTAMTEEGEEIIVGLHARKKIHKEFSRLSGFGALLALGSVGGMVFSSGIILMLTAVIFILYTVLCVGLPIYTLYGLFGLKGSEDNKALALKKIVKFSWIPIILFVVAMIISFVGAEYGFASGDYFTSLGSDYNIGTFLGVLSWGVFISLCGFILVAVKGAEI